ncbi:MAG: hypothetical protein FJ388_03720 [Verrucomicrobia bacterium]|nr:hypothetical protein [Verrucomicrobiota bacterium]
MKRLILFAVPLLFAQCLHAADAGFDARLRQAYSRLEKRDLAGAKAEFQKLAAAQGVDAQTKWEAEAIVEALDLLPRLHAKHPRLFVNESSWPAIKQRALGEEKEFYDQMARRVNALKLERIAANNFGMEAMEAALVYRVGGDKTLLEKLHRMLRVSMEVIPQRREGASERSFPAIAWSAALDWVWDESPADERQSLAATMLSDAWKRVEEARAAKKLAEWPHYYVRSIFWFVGVALLDASLDDVSFARAVALIGIGLKHYQERLAKLIEVGGEDGVWQTNPEYDLGSVPSPVFAFFHSWKAATGEELPQAWSVAGVSAELALRTVVGITRDHIRHFNYAGHSNGSWGFGQMRADLLADFLGQHIYFFGKTRPAEAAIAQHLRWRMAETGGAKLPGELPVLRFLTIGLQGPAQPAALPPLPLARHFASVGMVMMSSGFGPDDTYALYSQGGGVKGRRHDFDVTHFAIYKRGHLALDSGARFAAGHSANYRHQTVAHNAVLIHMPGEKSPRSQTGPVTANGGGQNRYPEEARPLAFESDRLFAYTATDATPVYSAAKCAQMTRQFVYLAPDHFVVFDRVVSTQPGYAKSWLLHAGNEPDIARREFRADNEGGRLFCRTLYPLDAVIEKIGGAGKEFWTDGRNWPIEDFWQTPGSRDWWKRYGKGLTEPPAAMGRWRVEVKPGAARADDCFLHVIQVSAQNVPRMIESEVRESGGRIILNFAANTRTCTFIFNKTGPIGGSLRIAQDGKAVVDKALENRIQR